MRPNGMSCKASKLMHIAFIFRDACDDGALLIISSLALKGEHLNTYIWQG